MSAPKSVGITSEELRQQVLRQALATASGAAAARAEPRQQVHFPHLTLLWAAAVGFSLALIGLCAGLALQSLSVIMLSGLPLGLASATLMALELLRQGKLHLALLTVTGVASGLALVMAPIVPLATAALILVPELLFILMLPYFESRTLLLFSPVCLLVTVIIFLLGSLPEPLVEQPPGQQGLLIGACCVAVVSTATLLMLWQLTARLRSTIGNARATSLALQRARGDLEDLVVVRTADLQAALDEARAHAELQARLLAENLQQRATIREMVVPVLPVSPRAIVIPLIGLLDNERLQALQTEALRAVQRRAARHVLLDITGVPVLDREVAQGLLRVVQSTRLLGAEMVLVGMRPEVAQTVSALGLHLEGVVTQHSLQQGIIYAYQCENTHVGANLSVATGQ